LPLLLAGSLEEGTELEQLLSIDGIRVNQLVCLHTGRI